MGAAASAIPTPSIGGLSVNQIQLIKQNMMNISTHSWEIGTELEALTELEYAPLSVFAEDSIPPHASHRDFPTDVVSIAHLIVQNKTAGMLPLFDGLGATGDPCSIGPGVLLSNWTRTNAADDSYALAASEQLQYILEVAPRDTDGTISQRVDQVQFWADFVYMAPPFIAYYGALENNQTLLETAYTQCMLYRKHLQDPTTGLWRHIESGNSTDDNLWATGNGWAASGMMRVLAAIKRSKFSGSMRAEQRDLEQWVNEIISGAWQFQHLNGTLTNYINNATTFPDSSGTAMIAAANYRYAKLTGDFTHIINAERAYALIRQNISPDGWLQDVVDPETFSTPALPGEHSPEGQSFVLLLESARADFYSLSITL